MSATATGDDRNLTGMSRPSVYYFVLLIKGDRGVGECCCAQSACYKAGWIVDEVFSYEIFKSVYLDNVITNIIA